MFEFNLDQKEQKKFAKEFAEKILGSVNFTEEYDTDKFKELWKEFANFGLMQLPLPEQYGGLDQNLYDIIAIMEGIGQGSIAGGFIFALNAHLWACQVPVFKFGNDVQKDKYLLAMAKGEIIGAHAISEQEAGSDIWNMSTNYVENENGFILNGIKTFITNAPVADLFLIYARQKNTEGVKGVSCFLVEKDWEGFSIGKNISKMGLEFSPFASVYMKDVFVPKENMLGKAGQGVSIFNFTMEYERPFIFSFQIGLMENQLTRCVKYARMRKQFKKKIIEFQSVSNKIAEMKVGLEASRLLGYKVVYEREQKKNTYLNSSIAKLFISETFIKNSILAMEIFGSYGYVKEYQIEKYLRDAMAGKFYSGTSDIQKNIISSLV